MATPHTTPSKLSTTPDVAVEPIQKGDHLYITAILVQGTVEIDSVSCVGVGPIAFPSPILCSTFTPDAEGQVAYFEQ